MTFGERIRALRIHAGYSTRKLGELARIDYSYVNKIEKQGLVPSLEIIYRLTAALDLSLEPLLTIAVNEKIQRIKRKYESERSE